MVCNESSICIVQIIQIDAVLFYYHISYLLVYLKVKTYYLSNLTKNIRIISDKKWKFHLPHKLVDFRDWKMTRVTIFEGQCNQARVWIPWFGESGVFFIHVAALAAPAILIFLSVWIIDRIYNCWLVTELVYYNVLLTICCRGRCCSCSIIMKLILDGGGSGRDLLHWGWCRRQNFYRFCHCGGSHV